MIAAKENGRNGMRCTVVCPPVTNPVLFLTSGAAAGHATSQVLSVNHGYSVID